MGVVVQCTTHSGIAGPVQGMDGREHVGHRNRARPTRLERLDALDQARTLQDVNRPGFNFHSLQGLPKRYTLHVNGPWCITFEWEDPDALRVDLDQYH